jgi:predicted RND superfamily exporter protein
MLVSFFFLSAIAIASIHAIPTTLNRLTDTREQDESSILTYEEWKSEIDDLKDLLRELKDIKVKEDLKAIETADEKILIKEDVKKKERSRMWNKKLAAREKADQENLFSLIEDITKGTERERIVVETVSDDDEPVEERYSGNVVKFKSE